MDSNAAEYEYREQASNYDEEVNAYDSYAHDVLFGMCYEYVGDGESLLDLGIGTGLASQQFADVGLDVYGLDISEDMIAACRAKGFAKELHTHDLLSGPIPYDDSFFNHVICCGAFHFFGDLGDMFDDVRRVLKSGGIFAYTVAHLSDGNGYREEPTAWGVNIFKHSDAYLHDLHTSHGLQPLKTQHLLIKGADKQHYNMQFAARVCRLG